MKFAPSTGALALDESFRDADGKVGFSFADKQWPVWAEGIGSAARSGIFAVMLYGPR